MIINLRGNVTEDGEINFDLVPLYFCVNQTVHATEVFLQFDKKLSDLNGYITTSLIDKSSINQKQQLIFFHQSIKSRQLYFAPTHIAEYKIQS